MDYKEEDEEDKKYKGKKFTRKDFKKDVKEAVQEAGKPAFLKKKRVRMGAPMPAGPRLSSVRFSTRRKRRSLSSPGFPAGPYRGRRQL